MMMSQLGRTLLSSSAGSADEQEGHADDSGSYGPLMDAIDEVIAESSAGSDGPR